MRVVEIARELQPLVRERAAEIEAARRLPADLASEIARAGLFRMLIPESVGGLESEPAEIAEAIETLAEADASTGWCLMVGVTTALTAAYLPVDTAKEIFADPNVITGGVFAPMGKAMVENGGYRVNGRWQWASGAHNCAWLCGGAMVFEDGELQKLDNGAPAHRMMLFPREQAELIDTWHVAGLKGTGSGDMAVTDIRVPHERSVSLVADKPVADGALYAFPAFGLLALGVACVALGNARAALDAIKALVTEKKPGGARRTLAERGAVQVEFAKARAEWAAARAFVYEALDKNWQAARATGELPLDLRAELRLACVHATRTCAGVTRVAYDLGGGSSVFLDNELQRRFRDAHTATQHVMVGPGIYELAGRIGLDQPTDAGML